MATDAKRSRHRHDLVDHQFDQMGRGRANQKTVVRVVITFVAAAAAFLSSILVVKSPELAIAVYVLGLGLLLIWVEPFLGLLNYLIFVYLRPQEFIGQFEGIPVMLLVGGATFGVTVLYYALRKQWMFKAPQDALVVWLYVAMIVSHLAHVFISGAVDAANYYANRVVLYLLFVGLVTSVKKLKAVLHALVLLTLFQAVQGIYQFRTGTGFGGQEMIEGRITGIGIFADPNNLAMTFLMVFPFLVFSLIRSRSFVPRLFFLGSMAVLIWGLILTDSRGGFLGLGAIVFTMVSRRFGFKKGFAVAFVLFAALFLLGPSRMRDFSTTEDSASGRVEAWAAGMEMFQSYPLFGVGVRNFTDHHWLAAHNSFIQCVAELGLFGAVAWVLLILVSLKATSFVATRAGPQGIKDLDWCAESIYNGLIAFLVTAFFISRAFNDLFFIAIGLCTAAVNVFVRNSDGKFHVLERKDLSMGLATTIGLLIVFKLYLMTYW